MEPIITIQVESKSLPGDFHNVTLYEDGTMSCDCKAFGFYKVVCWHIVRVFETIMDPKKEGVHISDTDEEVELSTAWPIDRPPRLC